MKLLRPSLHGVALYVTAFLGFAATPYSVAAQWSDQVPRTRIEIDQRSQAVKVYNDKDSARYYPWAYIPVPAGRVAIVLTNSSSALYVCTLGTKVSTNPQLDTLQSFLTAVTPYLGSPIQMVLPLGAPHAPFAGIRVDTAGHSTQAKQTALALAALDSLLVGVGGIESYRRNAMAALDAIYSHHHSLAYSFDSAAARLRDQTSLSKDDANDSTINGVVVANHAASRRQDAVQRDAATVDAFRHWVGDSAPQVGTAPNSLLSRYDDASLAAADTSLHYLQLAPRIIGQLAFLRGVAQGLFNALSTPAGTLAPPGTPHTGDQLILDQADSALANADAIVMSAYETESIADAVYRNTSTVHCGDAEVPKGQPRELDVSVTAQTPPELTRLAEMNPITLTVYGLTPYSLRWFHPVFGLAAMYAVEAAYPTYVAAKTTTAATSFSVVATGTQDYRGLYAVTLGQNWFSGPVGLVLPQFMVSPGPNTKAFGVGGALRIAFLTFGMGATWVQHNQYTIPPGDTLTDAGLLQSVSTYRGARTYFSLSASFWPTGLGSSGPPAGAGGGGSSTPAAGTGGGTGGGGGGGGGGHH